jgi:hypothetical protein
MVPLALIVLIALTPLFDTITANVATRFGFQIISACVWALGTIAGLVLFLGDAGVSIFARPIIVETCVADRLSIHGMLRKQHLLLRGL